MLSSRRRCRHRKASVETLEPDWTKPHLTTRATVVVQEAIGAFEQKKKHVGGLERHIMQLEDENSTLRLQNEQLTTQLRSHQVTPHSPIAQTSLRLPRSLNSLVD